jgi:hypothetical protein
MVNINLIPKENLDEHDITELKNKGYTWNKIENIHISYWRFSKTIKIKMLKAELVWLKQWIINTKRRINVNIERYLGNNKIESVYKGSLIEKNESDIDFILNRCYRNKLIENTKERDKARIKRYGSG